MKKKIVMTWKIVEVSEASVIYIYILTKQKEKKKVVEREF